jgi:ankyrin repeat protein
MGNHRLISKLIQKDTDINLSDIYGCTALHYAVITSNIKTVKAVLAAKPNIKVMDHVTTRILTIIRAD